MKRIVCWLTALLPIMVWAQERIMLLSDPHVLPLEVIATEPDFENYMAHQRKMVHLSEPIWNALMDTADKYRPELLLIPGDLTRDAEPESHAMVSASLQCLNEVGVKTLVIPGNHDILDDALWDDTYAWMYSTVTARDPNSHSYAAQPLEGVTVIGMDGTHKAGAGSLSKNTLQWVLAQADSAAARGHMIIAMCHWQLLEHIDKQSRVESSCRLKDADAIRDSLMVHGVHLVLTGHFHVNGITTYKDETGVIPDSLVEITTGAPITYPCPYRWLTLAHDRRSIQVETQNITSVDTIADLYAYSRAWMAEHAQSMLPQMSLRMWNRVDDVQEKLASQFGETVADRLVENCIPETDEEKIALVEKHMGSTIVELYLLHSDANEPENPQAYILAQQFYSGMDGMMDEMLDRDELVKYTLGIVLKAFAQKLAEEPVQSLVEDVTQWASDYPNRTDDLHLVLTVGDGYDWLALPQTEAEHTAHKIIRNGQMLIQRDKKTYSIQGQLLQ